MNRDIKKKILAGTFQWCTYWLAFHRQMKLKPITEKLYIKDKCFSSVGENDIGPIYVSFFVYNLII